MRHPTIGITGGMGCGKSEVGRILSEIGVEIMDSDALSHDLLREDESVKTAVIALCGPDVQRADGELDRAAIAAQVFSDESKRKALEALIHPRVWETIQRWRTARKNVAPAAALIPLLFEAGLTDGWDAIWCISAPDAVVNERLRGRGWSLEQIERRRRVQLPLEEKMRRSDLVIRNEGTREELKTNILESWTTLLKRSK
ncbi:MAG: dephospho-CoA kinase [Kiritimatiellae bacterium]|nr:dephospho-CoA kinase [Kiritimatiellia bacterium]